MRYWAPKLRAVHPGEWVQFDGSRRIAIIRTVRMSNPPRPLLRAETWADDELARDLIGYFPVDDVKLAAETVWSEYQAAKPPAPEAPMTQQYSSGDARWHPILNAEERTPGVWTMVDSDGREYGVVRIIRDGDVVLYEGTLRDGRPARYVRLRVALEAVHNAYVASQR